MSRLLHFALAAMFAMAAATSHAQTPPTQSPAPGGKERRMHDCSQAPDPAACEQRRQKARAAMQQAQRACEGRQGAERHACMSEQMCAQASDPERCRGRAKERSAQRQQAMAACQGRQGDEMRSCMREQRRKAGPRKPAPGA